MAKLTYIALFAVFLDQITKYIVRNFFSYTENYGAAFGLFQGHTSLFIIFGFLVVFLILYFKDHVKGKALWGLGFLLGGTIGNLLDRMVYSYVIDFISIWIWPSFNLADVFNVLGVILLIFYRK